MGSAGGSLFSDAPQAFGVTVVQHGMHGIAVSKKIAGIVSAMSTVLLS
jgi:hypothetical protein